MSNTIQLRQFEPCRMHVNALSVVIGKRNTGKTVLIKDLISHHEKAHNSVIFNAGGNDDVYSNIVTTNKQIYNTYSSDVINNLIEEQNHMIKNEIETTHGVDNRTLLILDDVYNNKVTQPEESLRNLLVNNKQYNINVYIAEQYDLLSPYIRSCVDYVFIFKESIPQNCKRIYDHFAAGMFPTFESFCQVLTGYTTTEDYNCLVIDYTSKSGKLEDMVFYYKAKY